MSSSYHQVQWAIIALLTLSQSRADCTSMDITKSSWEFCNFVQVLTIPQKCHLLKYHKQPHKDHVFPTRYLGGCHQGGFQHVTHQYGFQSTFGLFTVRWWMVHSMLVVLLDIIVSFCKLPIQSLWHLVDVKTVLNTYTQASGWWIALLGFIPVDHSVLSYKLSFEHNKWLHTSCKLGWHACHSAEVSENINLGYIQDQGYS